jgi:hypothetical protein
LRIIIGLLLALGSALPLCAQDTTSDNAVQSTTPAKVSLYRDPHRALVLGSLFPGAGYLYAGEYLPGVMAYMATVSSFGMGALVYVYNGCDLDFFKTCKPWPTFPHQAIGVAIAGLGLWKWISAARDAARAAERANARHAAASQRASLIVNPMGGAANATQVGMSVHW